MEQILTSYIQHTFNISNTCSKKAVSSFAMNELRLLYIIWTRISYTEYMTDKDRQIKTVGMEA